MTEPTAVDQQEEQQAEPPMEKQLEPFVDKLGVEWRPQFGVLVIREATRQLNVTIARMFTGDITVADMVDVLWYACKHEARACRVHTPEEFFGRFTDEAIMKQGVPALFKAITDAFPDTKDLFNDFGEESSEDPFDLGSLGTFLKSALQRA